MFMYKVLKPEFVATHKALHAQLQHVRESSFEPLERVTRKYGDLYDQLESGGIDNMSRYERNTYERINRMFIDVNNACQQAYHEMSSQIIKLIMDLETVGCHYIIPTNNYRVDESAAVNGVFYMEAHHASPLDAVPFLKDEPEIVKPVTYGESPANTNMKTATEVLEKLIRRDHKFDALKYMFEAGMHQPIDFPTDEQLRRGFAARRVMPDGTMQEISPDEFFKSLSGLFKK